MSEFPELSEFIVIEQNPQEPQIMYPIQSLEEVHQPIGLEPEYKYWTVDHSRMLIDLYSTYSKKLGGFEVRTLKKLWEKIASELNSTFNINVTPNNVENRWRVLDRNYKKYVDNNKQTGRGRKSFVYAEQMEGIFGKKKNIRPEILLSSSNVDHLPKIEKNICSRLEVEVTNDQQALIQKEKSYEPPSKKRRNNVLDNRNSILLGIKKDRQSYYEAKLKLENEKMEIEKEKLKEIKRKNQLLEERNNLLKEHIENQSSLL